VLDPAALPACDTLNVPPLVKVCILKSPDVVILPPDATTNCALDLPCKSDIDIAPLGTSASPLTAAEPMFIVVDVGETSNSSLTCERLI
jgi:hypothetical protein